MNPELPITYTQYLVAIEYESGIQYREDDFAAPVGLCGASKRESDDDDYSGVIVKLDNRHRIIDCVDDIQWIIQRRRGARWFGCSFHRDRDVLIERSRATGEALKLLQALPAWHA